MHYAEELEINRVCSLLRKKLYGAVRRRLAGCMLLSGGVDTSVIAAVSSVLTQLTGVTVAIPPAHDLPYAEKVAERFNIEHVVVRPSERELYEAVEEVIPVVRSFDPMEVHGGVAAYIALKQAREMGFRGVMTGDGGDELFAGYTFYYNLSPERLKKALEKTWQVMRFSSTVIGDSLGVEVLLPFLDDEFSQFAKGLDVGLKVRREGEKVWGKWILRKAYEYVIPYDVIWRDKLHIGAGSGVEEALRRIADKIPEHKYSLAAGKYYEQDGVRLRSREHLLYYEVFRRKLGPPRELGEAEERCPDCGAPLTGGEKRFCPTCGWLHA